MELSTARDITTGKKLIESINIFKKEEVIMLLMGACLTNEDDIVCLKCGLLNECCECQ